MMNKKSMTQAEFDALRPRLSRFSVLTTQIAEDILVKGKTPVEITKKYKVSKQSVHGMMSRVKNSIYCVPLDWRLIEVWLPPDLAESVLNLAEDVKRKYLEDKE